MDATDVELLQFPYSHYNEKARWALDWKRVPHRRRNLLPGPHAPRIQRLTGSTQVPVLRLGGEVVAGSARILEVLEARAPEPPLLPADPDERRRALEIQAFFDDEIGPAVRRAVFAAMLHDPAYVRGLFAARRPRAVRLLYRAAFPGIRRVMARSMGITGAAAVAEAAETARRGFDFAAKHGADGGPLVGDRFSVADLTAAALLAPIADPPDSPMEKPRPLPEPLAALQGRFADHPGVAWVHATYRRHRPPSAVVAETG